MLNIGNKKLKDANIGTTPLDSIYLGSTLIWKKIKYVQWYDPEFKRIILEKYNNGKEMTQDQLNKFRSQSKLSESDIILDHNLFENNQKLLSIKDLEKFVNFDVISPNMFAGCSKLGTTNLESTKDIDDHILEIPSNIKDIGEWSFYQTNYSGIKFDSEVSLGLQILESSGYSSGVFQELNNLSGILDLTKVNYINIYQEFNTLGSNGNGLQIVYPHNNNRPIFAGWFQNCNIKSFAPSKDQLEDNKIKFPEGITEITPLAFGNTRLDDFSVYIPNSVTKISGLFSPMYEPDANYIKLLDIGSGCKYIQGNSGNSNNSKYTIVCRATTPPLLTLGGPNYKYNNFAFDPNYNKAYPFIYGAAHIYVPDESVDLYKNDTKYGIQEQYSDEITEHTGTVECYGQYELKERNIGWSRFKDIIKPLSEYVES